MVIGVDDALILAGIAAAGGAASYFGTKETNAANQAMNAGAMKYNWDVTQWQQANQWEMFKQTQEFNRVEAEKARAFAGGMSGTSYQRARSDMLAAGLNPILAYAQGGATSPAVGAASVGTPSAPGHSSPSLHRMENALGPAVGSAMQAANTYMGLQQVAASVDQTQAQTALAGAQEKQAMSQAALNSATAITEAQRAGLVKSQRASEMVLPSLREAQAAAASASAGELSAREASTRQETEHQNRYGYGQSGREASSIAGIGRTFGRSSAEVTRDPAEAAGTAAGRLLQQWRQQQGMSWDEYRRSGQTIEDGLNRVLQNLRR